MTRARAAFWGGLTLCSLVGALVAGAALEAFTRRWPTGGAR